MKASEFCAPGLFCVLGVRMAAEVGSIIAQAQAKAIECAICGGSCEPVMLDRRSSAGDHFERLRCTTDGLTFRRIWIGGYAR